MPQDAVLETMQTLLVTREIHEHANVFHTLTDLLNVHITLHMLGWEDKPHQVLLLDSHPAGPLDPLWAAVAAGGGLQALSAPWNATGPGTFLVSSCGPLPLCCTPCREPWHLSSLGIADCVMLPGLAKGRTSLCKVCQRYVRPAL